MVAAKRGASVVQSGAMVALARIGQTHVRFHAFDVASHEAGLQRNERATLLQVQTLRELNSSTWKAHIILWTTEVNLRKTRYMLGATGVITLGEAHNKNKTKKRRQGVRERVLKPQYK